MTHSVHINCPACLTIKIIHSIDNVRDDHCKIIVLPQTPPCTIKSYRLGGRFPLRTTHQSIYISKHRLPSQRHWLAGKSMRSKVSHLPEIIRSRNENDRDSVATIPSPAKIRCFNIPNDCNIQMIVDSQVHISFCEKGRLRELFFEAIRFVGTAEWNKL
jgi:hypothetical protein